ncbi:MAG TPA: hypothetical protein VMD30_12400, partial [Tepidisphaeraceae bacterium]|nr:hypothetical protein [Tepidisphaeraceae bacterium]
SEDVAITWTGVDQASQSTADLLEAIAAGLEKLEHPGAWDYDVHRSTAAAAGARLEIHVFRRF